MDTSGLVQRLSLRLRQGAAKPVVQLVVEELWLAVVDGSLESGQRLPTARELAIALNVSPRSIERAYEELEQRGVTITRPGAGTFVSLGPVSEHDLARHERFVGLCGEVVGRAADLGYSVDELIDALAEYRSVARDDSALETE